MIGSLITLLIIGLIAGALARLIVPGKDPMGIVGTLILGVAGSFLGGFVSTLISGGSFGSAILTPAGIIGSVLGAIVVLLVYRQVSARKTVAR